MALTPLIKAPWQAEKWYFVTSEKELWTVFNTNLSSRQVKAITIHRKFPKA
jgi:outer membrane protein assembly factor BamE (lipoprotein component of BamABCDE complex)